MTKRYVSTATAPARLDHRSWSSIGDGEHAVQFYAEDRHLVELLTRYVGSALVSGDVAVVTATRAHRDALSAALKRRGMDLSLAERNGTYIALDAADTLRRFMRDGEPDEQSFRDTVGAALLAIADVCRTSSRRILAFGEMVALLWADGKPNAAIHLEELWNDLAQQCSFTLCCAYSIKAFNDGEVGAFMRICAQHSHVFAASNQPGALAAV